MALWLGAVPTALAYILFASGLRHLPANEVATLTLAEPVTAALLGAVVLGERPGPDRGRRDRHHPGRARGPRRAARARPPRRARPVEIPA